MKKHRFFFFLAATLALGLSCPLMNAGPPNGSLAGEVTDPSGALVRGAKVTVSGDQWSATISTDETGQYALASLPPGTYEVTVSSAGFALFDKTDVVVSAGDRTEMDARLNIATLQQTITVTEDESDAAPGGEK